MGPLKSFVSIEHCTWEPTSLIEGVMSATCEWQSVLGRLRGAREFMTVGKLFYLDSNIITQSLGPAKAVGS